VGAGIGNETSNLEAVMQSSFKTIALAAGFACCSLSMAPTPLVAQGTSSAQPDAAKIKVCSLLTAAEVKKHLPWRPQLDQFPPEEEALGNYGSSCSYPSVHVQVLPSTTRMLELAKEKGGLEKLSGIGNEAYFHNNKGMFAEVYVKTGKYLVTVQANESGSMSAAKSGAISLAKELALKLR
jgi:hypothetical protein